MDLHEDIARRAETAADGLLRMKFAERYRALIGVDPEQRHALRQALIEIDGAPVADVIAGFCGPR